MSEVMQWILVGVAVTFVAIERAVRLYQNIAWKRNGKDRRKNTTHNPGVQYTPGAAEACQKHGRALSEISNELKNIDRRLKRLET